jgi:hypothetical protein
VGSIPTRFRQASPPEKFRSKAPVPMAEQDESSLYLNSCPS